MRANRRIAFGSLVLIALVVAAAPAARAANQYNATFSVRPNGDVAVDMTFTLPMAEYAQIRNSLPMLQLLLRDLSSARSDIEVTDKHSDYNDAERSINFTMLALGGANNLGDHWEFEVDKGRVFSNLNEAERAMYFTPNIEGEMGQFQGQEKVVFPEQATQIRWDKGKRVASYVLPVPAAPCASGKTLFLCLSGLFILAGVTRLAVSFRKPAAAPKAKE